MACQESKIITVDELCISPSANSSKHATAIIDHTCTCNLTVPN